MHRPLRPRCPAHALPVQALDALVWADLCAVLGDRAAITAALQRAQEGAWLPQAVQARQATVQRTLAHLAEQEQRLLEAYLAAVLDLTLYTRKQEELTQQRRTLDAQQRDLVAEAQRQLDLSVIAGGIEEFCTRVRGGLAQAPFAQRRALVELLIDRVIVTGDEVEIRYAVPTQAEGPHIPFCHLRKHYRPWKA